MLEQTVDSVKINNQIRSITNKGNYIYLGLKLNYNITC